MIYGSGGYVLDSMIISNRPVASSYGGDLGAWEGIYEGTMHKSLNKPHP